MRLDHAPGLHGTPDLSGRTLALRTATGGTDVETPVAVPPHSGLTCAGAAPDRKVGHWTMAHRRAPEHFGGSPVRWVIDNLKSGVARADRGDPRPGPGFREFARHHGPAILPARNHRPRHRAAAESAVRTVQGRVLPPPRADPWDRGDWLRRRVGPDGHLSLGRNRCPVPEGSIGREVGVCVGGCMIGVFVERGGGASPSIASGPGAHEYATDPARMPDRPRAVRGIRGPDHGGILIGRARGTGANALSRAERCMAPAGLPRAGLRHRPGHVPPWNPWQRPRRRGARRGAGPRPPRLRLPPRPSRGRPGGSGPSGGRGEHSRPRQRARGILLRERKGRDTMTPRQPNLERLGPACPA